ncbi:MAG TPA: outer membrane beta-barrel protein [Gammaproteobacteria bacterium]
MRKQSLLFAGALLPLACAAQEAQQLDYTFVEVGYLNSEIDAGPLDVDGDGLGLDGSLSITDSVFVFAGYDSFDYDAGVDATSYGLGAGMHWTLKPELDLVADLGWVHAEVDRPILPDVDDDGLGLGVGLRSRVHEAIEVQAGIRHIDLDDSDTFLTLGGRYYFTDSVAAGLGLSINDDDTGWSLGLRAEFGN